MPSDLASHLLRKHARRERDDQPRCSDCGRTPLTGELLHATAGEHVLCTLCLERIPEADRDVAATSRVHATPKPLAVMRQAA